MDQEMTNKQLLTCLLMVATGIVLTVSYYRMTEIYKDYRSCIMERKSEDRAVAAVSKLHAEVYGKKYAENIGMPNKRKL
jgi:hypothetical protein